MMLLKHFIIKTYITKVNMTVNARKVNVMEKQKGNSGQTRTKHQFQKMNEITDTKTKNVVFANQECKKINRIQAIFQQRAQI